MGLLTFDAHEIILTAVLKDELHKVTMYSLSQIDHVKEHDTHSNF